MLGWNGAGPISAAQAEDFLSWPRYGADRAPGPPLRLLKPIAKSLPPLIRALSGWADQAVVAGLLAPFYSGTTSPEPPNSLGKSFNLVSPSRIGSTVSA